MSTPVPSTPDSAGRPGQTAGDTPVGPSPEESFRLFWEKNARTIFIVCALILLGILAKGGYDYYLRQREKSLESEYAAATTSDKLRSFAAAHPDTTLGGVAQLQLADEAYSGDKYSDAVALYQKAIDAMKNTPMAGRAQLGLALSKVQAGQTAEGEAKLKDIAGNAKLMKVVQAEANYDLATLAIAGGKPEEASKYLDAVNAVDPGGSWTQRALALRATLPPEAATTKAPESAPSGETAR